MKSSKLHVRVRGKEKLRVVNKKSFFLSIAKTIAEKKRDL